MTSALSLPLLDSFSLEMTGKDVPDLREAQGALPRGTKVNVTFLGNEDLDMRVGAARVAREMGFLPVPHVSARRLGSQAAFEEFLARLQDADATESLFAVGGDPAEPEGPYADSLSLIRTGLFQKHGAREVSIAGYPEGHPDISADRLWEHLEAKTAELQSQGLRCVILTQFAFDAPAVVRWILEARRRGIDCEIRVGVPGPAGVKRLLGYARRFGVGSSAAIVRKYGFSLTNLMGTAGPGTFLRELASLLAANPQRGTVRTHFYTFGGLVATAEWASAFAAEGTEQR